ncbi:unnamed protein product [Blepharisma stoltei]|uniref:Uncharacterized protein n=1 Tax=Blepharisma stoltei TaxID=1481888 RepID=A0AAU9JAR6_9CILI|nr:unnamed protein product [Blepharisma stoltei]
MQLLDEQKYDLTIDWVFLFELLSDSTRDPLNLKVLDTVVFDVIDPYRPLTWIFTNLKGELISKNIRDLMVDDVIVAFMESIYKSQEHSKNAKIVIINKEGKRNFVGMNSLSKILTNHPQGIHALQLFQIPNIEFDKCVYLHEIWNERGEYMERYFKKHILDKKDQCEVYNNEEGIQKIKTMSRIIIERVETSQLTLKGIFLLYYLEKETLNPWLCGAENCSFVRNPLRAISRSRNKSANCLLHKRHKTKDATPEIFPIKNIFSRSTSNLKQKIDVAFPTQIKHKLLIENNFLRPVVSQTIKKRDASPDASPFSQQLDFSQLSYFSNEKEEAKIMKKNKSFTYLQPNSNAFSEAKFDEKIAQKYSYQLHIQPQHGNLIKPRIMHEVPCPGEFCNDEAAKLPQHFSPLFKKSQRFLIPQKFIPSNEDKISFQNAKLRSLPNFKSSLSENSIGDSLKEAFRTKKLGKAAQKEVAVCLNCYLKYTTGKYNKY